MRCLEARLVGTGTDAMRHLIEAVAQRLGADFDRLKQNVVFWVARHTFILSLRGAVFLWGGLAPQGEALGTYSRTHGGGEVTTARVGSARGATWGVREHRKQISC